jgi:hypothetical protein
MKNGYEIHWTDNALIELEKTILYLQANWTDKEIRNLAIEIEKTTLLIAKNPFLFPESIFKRTIRKAVILSHNSMYYRITKIELKFSHSF